MAQTAMGRVRRRWVIVAVAVIIVVALILSGLSGFYVDILWFREVHFSGVFWSIFWSKMVLGLSFGAVFFLVLLANLLVVQRVTPKFRITTPEQEAIERYRQAFEPYLRYVIPAIALIGALFAGLAAGAHWQTFLLWRSVGSVTFHKLAGVAADPVFHRDPSFYIFVLPFQKFVQGWLFSALVWILIIAAIAHYLSGNIRTQGPGERATPAVRGHLSVLLGLIFLVKAWGYYLGRFDLLVSPRGVVTGASYTDIHVQKPALLLLAIIAVFCAVLFLVNIRYRLWALPAIGFGLLLLSSVVVGAIVPAVVQRFQVAPQELQKETPFIARDISATRFAYGLSRIHLTAAPPSQDITAAQVDANQATTANIRLWNPDILKQTYQALQRIQPYYEFNDVDVDRYNIRGQERMVMLSPREVSQNGVPGNPGWQSVHLIYTHGYGSVASQVSTSTTAGAPDFLLSDIPTPPGSPIKLNPGKGSQLYYGELHDVPYVVTDTGQRELNFPNPAGGTVTTTYDGSGGIPVGSFFRKAVFAYRYRDFNLLISGLVSSKSKILINRDIRTRVFKAAPFLQYDNDPYSAVIDGQLFYIWDAYTTTDLYPYSNRQSLGAITNGDMGGRVNYIRNSVKVVINAYTGTIRFYLVDPTDPLIRVWQQAFPHLFTPLSQASADLRAHFRYPEDLLQVQAALYSRYHVMDPTTFFSNTERWAVPGALPGGPNALPPSGTLRPYYVLFKLPGTSTEQFVLFEPLTPFQRENQMVGYVAAGSDP
ncbi:MAG TPA: UPF0182 family protein, partial [Actinomycetota bacterium]